MPDTPRNRAVRPEDAFVAEVARLCAAAETLSNIGKACGEGIPAGLPTFVAASVVVAAYEEAAPLPSPFRTVVE